MRTSGTNRAALEVDADELAAVGRRLRTLREARGLSLSELARRAGIGKATLSGLEAGTRNATLETLWSVTAQLDVPLATLLASPSPRTTPTPAEVGARAFPLVRGEAVEAVLLEVFEDAGVTYELYRIRLPARSSQVSPGHPVGVTEHLTVFSGGLRAGPVASPLVAGPGEHISWRSDVPHGYEVVGDEDVHASLLMRYPRR
ncbi:XRE family transcriptional regulator [Thermomonospora umbrina]|uniref:XRE family transcriptional regulator n=1 Tax=Thermomonospora umbrina TaxID=111806 RepID=A0A3D9SGB0_9ACTN|nr:XRE family transcriptional regulator [Thermomonospora umbrina]REE94958.1 XRE family transcriptional regulator [Thermomonospora umbrina]